MLHCKFYYYYNIEFECVFLLCLEWEVINILLSSPSRTVFLWCCLVRYIVPSPLAQALYLTRQHYRRTVPSGVDNNRIILLDFVLIMLWRYRCYHDYITIINSIAAIFPSIFRYWRMFIRFVSVYCIIFVSIVRC